ADLCNHVRQHGLERTLERLAREGVYLTADEYKGKRDVVRAGESFRIVSRNFAEKDGARGLAMQSSGTRNVPARNMMTLDRITEKAFEEAIFLAAHNLFSYCHAVYDGILPAGGGLNYTLVSAKLGVPVDRWFARKMPVNSWVEERY